MTESHRATGDQYFHLMDFDIFFDVGMAKQMVGFPYAKPDTRLPVESISWALLGVDVDHQHIHGTNLQKPLILGSIGSWKFLMDGHHRLTKAVRRKVPTLPVYVLDVKETRRTCSSRNQFDIMQRLVTGLPVPVFSHKLDHECAIITKVPPTMKLEARG